MPDFARKHSDIQARVMDVFEARQLSDRISKELDIGHASPQVILLRDGQPAWIETHFSISGGALERAVALAGDHA